MDIRADPLSLEPALGTPPGSPASSPRPTPSPTVKTAEQDIKHAADEATFLTPRESQPASTATLDSGRPGLHGHDDFLDIALDDGVGIVVTKSIFKEKRGFLSRLRGASSSSVKNKYVRNDSTAHTVVPAGEPDSGFVQDDGEPFHLEREGTNGSVEIVREEEEPIDVSIAQTTPPRDQSNAHQQDRMTYSQEKQRDEESDDNDVCPQVVIHSAESDSDSGFATLNPIINRASRGKRGSTSAITSGPSAAANPPVLISLPIAEEPTESSDRLVLVICALGATGLSKVEKFGTQSTLLEMRLCESTDQLSSGASHLTFLRTALHKKGGSEAQWNQQFTTGLRSKTKQLLHIAVRTHSKLLVGETTVSLAEVSEALYDQHFSIFRTTGEDGRESAGHVHLQLRIVEATQTAPAAPPTASSKQAAALRQGVSGPIPPALRNGALMFKIPYHTHGIMGSSSSTRQWISLSDDANGANVCIAWCDPIDTTEKCRRLDVCLVTEVREGARTKAFKRLLQTEPSSVARESERCFSIISKTRTLDLVAASKEEAAVWIDGLRQIIFGKDQDMPVSETSSRTIQDFRCSALATRDLQAITAMSTTAKKQQILKWRACIFEFARQNETDYISTCLHDGCPIDLLETGTGDTLLMLACRLGNAKLVELCLLWRAKNDPHPEFGETALQVAVNAGHSDCLGLILTTAAKSEMDSEIVNHIDSKNDAPLHVAARRGDLACLQLLLHHGADICVVEEFGRTPLHCATLSGNLDCVAYLLDVGGDSVLNAGDHDGDTALHYAALAGVESIVKLLLESAADVQATNIHGETALDLAQRDEHELCERLIVKYHLATIADTSTPATRNEIASSLLVSHHKSEPPEFEQDTDEMDECDEDDYDDEDPEANIDKSYSPVRRGPIEPNHFHTPDLDQYQDFEHYVTRSSRSSSSGSHASHPISPSARVREALASQRERRSFHSASPVPLLHFHSARDDFQSRYALGVYNHHERQAYTERFDRDQLRSRGHPSYSRYGGYNAVDSQHPYELIHRLPTYVDDHGYLSPSTAFYGHGVNTILGHGYRQYPSGVYDNSSHGYDQEQHFAAHHLQQSSTNVASLRQDTGWHDPYQPQAPPEATHASSSAAAAVWDTYHSDDGHPYYVNRNTGESQWENPYGQRSQPQPPLPPAVPVAVHLDSSSGTATKISADAEIRIRRAAARELQNVGGETGNPFPPTEDASLLIGDCESQPHTLLSKLELATPEDFPSPPFASPNSKYEARTGLTLSIDVMSPVRKDADRAIFVASPRSRSSRKFEAGRNAKITDNSFGRSSRASSPRGKSRNVQLIELKRANNLAMALASFKINDRNEQVVQAITTLDENIINAELLVCLQRFFPTDEEAAQLKAYQGPTKSLGPAERFFFQLLQVTDVAQRIECFLYKLQFARSYRSVYSKIQVVKRACRDVVENFSFAQALTEFFKQINSKSLQTLQRDARLFRTDFLPCVEEKLHTFHDDLQKASEIELLDVQLQINRLIAGVRLIQSFVEKTSPPSDRDAAAHDILYRFLSDTRGKLTDLETEYESLGQWENKILDLFGESKATCQLAPILECLCSVLDKASC